MVSRIQQRVPQIDADLERARRDGLVQACVAAEQSAALPRGLLLAVASRESGCRNIVGDHGHGRGVFQIDDRLHADWLRRQGALAQGAVPSPAAGARHAAGLLAANLAEGEARVLVGRRRLKFALSAYNAGVVGAEAGLSAQGDSDAETTGADYGADVLRRLERVRVWLRSRERPGPEVTPVLQMGSRGPAVRELERWLARWFGARPWLEPPPFRVDGRYDEALERAVRIFQELNGLDLDGVAGPQVWGTLLAR